MSSAHIYEGTRGLLRDNLSRLGISTTFVDDIRDLGAWEAAIRPETRVLFAESISNAANRLIDTTALADGEETSGVTGAAPVLVTVEA